METYYWFRDGEFGEVHAYTWNEAREELANKFYFDSTDDTFGILDGTHRRGIPRWAVPKEFLVKLMLLGVPL